MSQKHRLCVPAATDTQQFPAVGLAQSSWAWQRLEKSQEAQGDPAGSRQSLPASQQKQPWGLVLLQGTAFPPPCRAPGPARAPPWHGWALLWWDVLSSQKPSRIHVLHPVPHETFPWISDFPAWRINSQFPVYSTGTLVIRSSRQTWSGTKTTRCSTQWTNVHNPLRDAGTQGRRSFQKAFTTPIFSQHQ